MRQNIRSHYIGDIEILRAFAILLVVFHHASKAGYFLGIPFTKEFFHYFGGGKGVDLFFVISGFVIARSLLPKLQGAVDRSAFLRQAITFWIRRFWRLAPSAWLWLLIPVFLAFFFNASGTFGTLKGNFAGMAAGILNVYNFYFVSIFGDPVYGNTNFVHWTLSLEAQFYFILPFVIYFSRNRLEALLLILVILQLLIFRNKWMLIARMDGFFLGVLIAYWKQNSLGFSLLEPKILNSAWARGFFSCLLIFALLVVSGKLKILPQPYKVSMAALVSGIAVIVASFDKGYIIRSKWLKKVLVWIGARSYGIYLVHIPILHLMIECYIRQFPKFQQHDQWGVLVALFVFLWLLLTTIISELNFRFIEEPFRKTGRRIAKNTE